MGTRSDDAYSNEKNRRGIGEKALTLAALEAAPIAFCIGEADPARIPI